MAAVVGLVVSILLSRYAYRYMYVRDLDSNEMSADAAEPYNLEGENDKDEKPDGKSEEEVDGGNVDLELVDLEQNDRIAVAAKRAEIRGAAV